MKGPKTYEQWETIRLKGRGGKKKVRRDTTLTKDGDKLVFTYDDKELLATLTPDNTYTIYKDKGYFYPTYSNIFMLVAGAVTYNDASHFKHYAQSVRVGISASNRWYKGADGKWERQATLPFTSGLQFRNGACLNPDIAIDYKRVLNREKSLPWLRKTVVLAKVLRVAVRLGIIQRDRAKQEEFEDINIDNPTGDDAQIILNRGNAAGIWRIGMRNNPEEVQAILKRCAENGLVDYREWLYKKHGCYEMLAVERSTNEQGEPA